MRVGNELHVMTALPSHSQEAFLRSDELLVMFLVFRAVVYVVYLKVKQLCMCVLQRMQTKPEFNRQSLEELMIRPVQRLPSLVLQVRDMLKYTQAGYENHPDVPTLVKAIAKLENVLQ